MASILAIILTINVTISGLDVVYVALSLGRLSQGWRGSVVTASDYGLGTSALSWSLIYAIIVLAVLKPNSSTVASVSRSS